MADLAGKPKSVKKTVQIEYPQNPEKAQEHLVLCHFTQNHPL